MKVNPTHSKNQNHNPLTNIKQNALIHPIIKSNLAIILVGTRYIIIIECNTDAIQNKTTVRVCNHSGTYVTVHTKKLP